MRANVAIGLVGMQKDAGDGQERWTRWRPTVSLGQHADLPLRRFELLYQPKMRELAERAEEAWLDRLADEAETEGGKGSVPLEGMAAILRDHRA